MSIGRSAVRHRGPRAPERRPRPARKRRSRAAPGNGSSGGRPRPRTRNRGGGRGRRTEARLSVRISRIAPWGNGTRPRAGSFATLDVLNQTIVLMKECRPAAHSRIWRCRMGEKGSWRAGSRDSDARFLRAFRRIRGRRAGCGLGGGASRPGMTIHDSMRGARRRPESWQGACSPEVPPGAAKRQEVCMVTRLFLVGSVLGAALFVGSPAARVGRRPSPVATRNPPAARHGFSRRRAPADADEAPGEFVHAIERGRIDRSPGIVRA